MNVINNAPSKTRKCKKSQTQLLKSWQHEIIFIKLEIFSKYISLGKVRLDKVKLGQVSYLT